MSFGNSEVLPTITSAFKPLKGLETYNKKNAEEAYKAMIRAVHVLEEHLLVHTFLVGERISLADIFMAGMLVRGFDFFFDKAWRAENPNVTRWYETVYNQPIYSAVVPKLNFIDEAIKYTPPKKEEKPKQEKAPKAEKAAAKPKAKEVDEDEEEEEKPAPKPKHPLEALPKPTVPLDELKRQYSNSETPDALKWFWEHYNPEDYSLWKMEYKYNGELTMTFMTSNLIGRLLATMLCNDVFAYSIYSGGFFTRLEASRKYIFGCGSVYGVTNDSVVQGAFVIRGQDADAAFDVAPDYESYSFTKLDASKEADKKFVDKMWTWEDGIEVNGKKYDWADGKVFK